MRDITIKDVENMNKNDMAIWEAYGEAEHIIIKEHDCYLVDLEGYLGYSILIFKNGRHINYANDYELHHHNRKKEELRDLYIKEAKEKLFTESELLDTVKSYREYHNKYRYLMSYWTKQFDCISMWHIGDRNTEEEERISKMFPCRKLFTYFPDKDLCDKANGIATHLDESMDALILNPDTFLEMVAYELANYEAGYTQDYRDALSALGLEFDNLNEWQKAIVERELDKLVSRL